MNNNKELIKEIADRLKAKKDFAYKEGAWERFQEFEKSSKSDYNRFWLYGSVAMLFVGLTFAYYVFNAKVDVEQLVQDDLIEDYVVEPEVDSQTGVDLIGGEQSGGRSVEVERSGLSTFDVFNKRELNQLASLDVTNSLSNSRNPLDAFSSLTVDFESSKISLQGLDHSDKYNSSDDLIHHLVLANAAVAKNTLSSVSLENSLTPKSFRFGEHFDFGLYLSSYRTTDNLKVGAGFTFAYNISDKVSLRTGASFNNYEVGILKNPLDAGSVEAVNMPIAETERLNSLSFMPMYDSKLMVPNVNAITGFVQSVEIPLEVKYNLNKSLYAVAGVSYSTILSQERNAQYVENMSSKTFDSGFSKNDYVAVKEEKIVTKTVRSAENNVNTNGYNGFVNLSVGKKVNVNRKFGVSVEPYLKIPVGEFRKSDMNYTNGGIRIMTNF